jgi:phosphopentomutase
MEFRRIVCLVADGFGVGEAPDAEAYGDGGSNTLAHVCEAVGGLKLPNLQRLGLGNLGAFEGLPPTPEPLAWVGRLAEKSSGKDTVTGHWEIAGIVTKQPLPTYPKGFPSDLVDAFVREAELPGVLGNYPASGTTILQTLGEEHLKTSKPILYTSADSVFQIAAHEEKFGLERLYRICGIARRLTEPLQIGRVIARPFTGNNSLGFRRTEHRRDYALSPGPNCLDALKENGVGVYSVGKIDDIFDHRGITAGRHTGNNQDSLEATFDFFSKAKGEKSFIFTNLVDFDMLYGHRRDPKGYANALSQLDKFLPKFLAKMEEGDALLLTSDHGCDPTYRGTDHTREYVPLVGYVPGTSGGNLGDRGSFADIAAFLLSGYGIPSGHLPGVGKNFLEVSP